MLMGKFATLLGLKIGDKFTLDLPSQHGMCEDICNKTYVILDDGICYESTDISNKLVLIPANDWIYWALLVGEKKSHLRVVRQ